VRILGVDVSLGRGLDVVLLEDEMVKESWSRMGPSALTELLWTQRPDAVAIDAPPAVGLGLLRDEAERARLPVPPPTGKHLARRIAEYELSRRGIGSHQTHYEEARLFSWMTAGFETFKAAREAGYPSYLGKGKARRTALEVFPYASYVSMAGCLSPGRRWRLAWRRAVLAEGGLTGLPEDAWIDLLDAACAAFTGERFLQGEGCFVGDSRASSSCRFIAWRSITGDARRPTPRSTRPGGWERRGYANAVAAGRYSAASCPATTQSFARAW
jgi:hypothetical protein